MLGNQDQVITELKKISNKEILDNLEDMDSKYDIGYENIEVILKKTENKLDV